MFSIERDQARRAKKRISAGERKRTPSRFNLNHKSRQGSFERAGDRCRRRKGAGKAGCPAAAAKSQKRQPNRRIKLSATVQGATDTNDAG